MEPPTELTNETASNARAGLLFIGIAFIALPLLLAYLFGAWSLALAAWNLMVSQIG